MKELTKVLVTVSLLYKSSNINEVIRSVLSFLNFFYDKISQVQKSTKGIQGTKKH